MNNKLILKTPVNLDKILKKSAKPGANLTEFERDYLVRLCGDFRGQMTREIEIDPEIDRIIRKIIQKWSGFTQTMYFYANIWMIKKKLTTAALCMSNHCFDHIGFWRSSAARVPPRRPKCMRAFGAKEKFKTGWLPVLPPEPAENATQPSVTF